MDEFDLLISTNSPFSLDICTLVAPLLRFRKIRVCFWIEFCLIIFKTINFFLRVPYYFTQEKLNSANFKLLGPNNTSIVVWPKRTSAVYLNEFQSTTNIMGQDL